MDKRPKRRKYKDNPYELQSINNKYFIKFKDSKNIMQIIEVNLSVFETFDKFELNDLSELNEFDNHIEHSEILEDSLFRRSSIKQKSTEEIIEDKIGNEELYKAINNLSDIQKRRIKMYYFENMTVQEIAYLERTSHQAVSKSIRIGIEEIKKILKN